MVDFVGPHHVGWGVKDPTAMAAFYRDVMGMTIVMETPPTAPVGHTIFLSRHPEKGTDHHDLVFFANPMLAHTAFKVESLADLLTFFHEVKNKGVPITFTFLHGFWLSFYFNDPEGHSIEIFWQTGVIVPNDFQVYPIDLERSEEDIMQDVSELRAFFGDGTRTTAAEWNATHEWNPRQWAANRFGGSQPNVGEWGNQPGATEWNANPPKMGQWGNQGNAGQWGQRNTGDWNKRVIDEFRANGGKVAMLPTPVLLLTTTGRKSGKSYTIPVGYMTDADRFIVVPNSATADWYLNILANSQVTVELGTESFTAIATLVEGEQRVSFLEQAHRVAEAAASAWRPAEAGNLEEHVPTDGPVVALQRVV